MGRILKNKSLVGALAGVLFVVWCVVAYLQSGKPDLPKLKVPPDAHVGTATVQSMVVIMRSQLDGFGGWLPNDLPGSPGYFLDNLPNFQLGVLQVIRHGTRVLRDNLSRQRTSDAVPREADAAYSAFANDPRRWAFPSAEGAFERGILSLERFRDELGGTSNFYPRADNLIQLLDPLMSELGAVNTQLLEAREGNKVPWSKIDDNFYYAQGAGYAMLGLMLAVKKDFAGVLGDKNAVEITDLIIKSLQQSQFEPLLVTNGDRDGILANHSSNLKAYLDDARQKMYSLTTILRQG
jgi:hypothetical protein